MDLNFNVRSYNVYKSEFGKAILPDISSVTIFRYHLCENETKCSVAFAAIGHENRTLSIPCFRIVNSTRTVGYPAPQMWLGPLIHLSQSSHQITNLRGRIVGFTWETPTTWDPEHSKKSLKAWANLDSQTPQIQPQNPGLGKKKKQMIHGFFADVTSTKIWLKRARCDKIALL